MATATDRQKTAKENFAVPDSGERKVSLLVVEDDENISTAISEYFSRAGYNVRTVEDGLNGVKAALDDPPDAVVLDLMLPKMDGLAVCKELREKVGYLPILMLTAKDDVVDKVLGLEMGADDYITKPFSLREKIWDYSYEGYDRTIDSHINRLRAKIEENPENPQMVLTVWGIGYKFSDEQ
jgi:DNA-binding response OmpR family regulator